MADNLVPTPVGENRTVSIPTHQPQIVQPAPPQRGQLAFALASAQGEFLDLAMDRIVDYTTKDGGKIFYKYASLPACNRAVKAALAKNGLAITQMLSGSGNKVILETVLVHKSGESVSSRMEVVADTSGKKNQIQALGSAITYLRRYMICSLLNLAADEDTDATGLERLDIRPPERVNENQGNRNNRSERRPPATKSQQEAKDPKVEKLKVLWVQADKQFWSSDDVHSYVRHEFKKESTNDLTEEEYTKIRSVIAANSKAAEPITSEQMAKLVARAEKNGWEQDQFNAIFPIDYPGKTIGRQQLKTIWNKVGIVQKKETSGEQN